MAGISNPFLAGYEQYILRQNLESSRPELQPGLFQPIHPVLPSMTTSRTPAATVVTSAPAAPPDLPQQQTQPSRLNDESGVDVIISGQGGAYGGPPEVPTAGTSTRPQTPTTVSISTRPPGVVLGQPAPAAVEITISTEADEERAEQPLGSHLQGLTVQQMLDLDIDALVVKIDKHHNQAKKAVLDHFMETKARLMQTQNEAVEDERQKGAAQLATKEEELNLVKAELEVSHLKARRLWDLLTRACTVYSRAKERRRINMAQFQVFCAWRHQAMLLARRRRLLARAERWDVNVHLKRNVFRAWFREAMREHRVTVNNRYIQEIENAKRLIHDHYQGQVAELERILAEAHLQIEREAEARSKLEDNMKRAFMRGVCALNIEAMNIMKRGPPQGAANPGNTPSAMDPATHEVPPAASAPVGGMSNQAQSSSAPVLSEPLSLDLRGSIMLSPTHASVASAATSAGAGPSSGLGVGQAGAPAMYPSMPPATSAFGNNAVPSRPSSAAYTSSASTSGRPTSCSGLGGAPAGVGGNPLVVKAAGAPPSAGAMFPGQGAPAGGSEGGPVIRETAQTFYQRPPVLVTRGPGMPSGAPSSDVPRPRSGAPLPTVRML